MAVCPTRALTENALHFSDNGLGSLGFDGARRLFARPACSHGRVYALGCMKFTHVHRRFALLVLLVFFVLLVLLVLGLG